MYPRMRMVVARLMRRRLIVPWLARAYCESLRRKPQSRKHPTSSSNGSVALAGRTQLALQERHARNIEVLEDINSSHAFAPEIIRD
jgi:hypothetical protein